MKAASLTLLGSVLVTQVHAVHPNVVVKSFGRAKSYTVDFVQGASFGEICGMTDKFEGCVVREMRRLDELMKNLHLAAKVSFVLPAMEPAVSKNFCRHGWRCAASCLLVSGPMHGSHLIYMCPCCTIQRWSTYSKC